jgi:uncharacterized protein (UPF0332 family)
MRQSSQIEKLVKLNTIKPVEPNDEVSKSYVLKSQKSLRSAKTTLRINSLEDSISLSYYSMYYMATALLYKAGIKCENHAGTIIIIKELFEINNEPLLIGKKERIEKQYYIDFNITRKDAKDIILMAEEFNKSIIGRIDTISNNELRIIRESILRCNESARKA